MATQHMGMCGCQRRSTCECYPHIYDSPHVSSTGKHKGASNSSVVIGTTGKCLISVKFIHKFTGAGIVDTKLPLVAVFDQNTVYFLPFYNCFRKMNGACVCNLVPTNSALSQFSHERLGSRFLKSHPQHTRLEFVQPPSCPAMASKTLKSITREEVEKVRATLAS